MAANLSGNMLFDVDDNGRAFGHDKDVLSESDGGGGDNGGDNDGDAVSG
jgi:hypothetical protein